jgi:CubicO group peptidase (beta-lactamase class C family)
MKELFKICFCITLSIIIFSLCSCPTPEEYIENMSSRELIEKHTKGVRRAALTVGIVQDGQMSFKVYGENSKERQKIEHIYEIGSITKTFTGQLFAKAIHEGLITIEDLDKTIDTYLDLPSKNYYPTIKRLLTHTSGYRSEYYWGFISSTSFVLEGQYIVGVTKRMILDLIGTINLENKDYPWMYSNTGIAVAGFVLEKIYNEDYTSLMNRYMKNDLGLNNTKISNENGDLSNYWKYDDGNPYIPSGAIKSTITDMMRFAKMQMDGIPGYVSYSHSDWHKLKQPIKGFHIRDAMGLAWNKDSVNNIYWHGGTTATYHSYLGFDKTRGIAVVVLSNVGDLYISAEAIGSTILKELQ